MIKKNNKKKLNLHELDTLHEFHEIFEFKIEQEKSSKHRGTSRSKDENFSLELKNDLEKRIAIEELKSLSKPHKQPKKNPSQYINNNLKTQNMRPIKLKNDLSQKQQNHQKKSGKSILKGNNESLVNIPLINDRETHNTKKAKKKTNGDQTKETISGLSFDEPAKIRLNDIEEGETNEAEPHPLPYTNPLIKDSITIFSKDSESIEFKCIIDLGAQESFCDREMLKKIGMDPENKSGKEVKFSDLDGSVSIWTPYTFRITYRDLKGKFTFYANSGLKKRIGASILLGLNVIGKIMEKHGSFTISNPKTSANEINEGEIFTQKRPILLAKKLGSGGEQAIKEVVEDLNLSEGGKPRSQTKDSKMKHYKRLFKDFLFYTHNDEFLQKLIVRFNETKNWIRSLNPTKTFIYFLENEMTALKNPEQKSKSTKTEEKVKRLAKFIRILKELRKDKIIPAVIKKIFTQNEGKYNASDIENWLYISERSACFQLKKIFTNNQYDYYVRTQTYADLNIAKKIIKEKGGKCHTKSIKNAKSKLHVECKDGHHFYPIYDSLVNQGTWCPNCNIYISESVCRKFFEQIFKRPFLKSYPPWLVNESGNQMELDGYNKELKLAFEYQGIQHRKKAFYMTDEDFKQRKKDDSLKVKLCAEHGINLIQVPDDEILPYNKMQAFIIKEYQKKTGKTLAKTPKFDYKKFIVYENRYAKKFREYIKSKGGTLLSPYITAKKKVKIMCEHGHIWNATPDSIYQGNWCPYCAGNAKDTDELFKKIGKKFDCNLISEYKNAKTPLWYLCKKGHKFKKDPFYLKKNYKKLKTMCPDCLKESYATKFKEFVERKGGTLLTPYEGRFNRVKIRCRHGHVFEITPGYAYQGGWCNRCKK